MAKLWVSARGLLGQGGTGAVGSRPNYSTKVSNRIGILIWANAGWKMGSNAGQGEAQSSLTVSVL